MLLATVVFMLSLAAKIKTDEHGVFFKIEENSFLFHENAFWNGKADSLMSCSQMCARQDACKSANFIASQGTCSLLTDIQTKQSKRLLKQDGSFYLEKVVSPGIPNSPDNSNAITPRPNWPAVSKVDVPVSTTPPLNETDYNAINFSQWKQLGREILIKSNINNWLICHPGTGSLVDWQDGNISCRVTKHVTDTCNGTAPPWDFKSSNAYGPRFRTSANYYYFDGYTRKNWPTHDPCGKNAGNHVKNVIDPHGNIFIRA
ncbi:uncharacterized protein LOC144627973 isoform X2 [Oculina patagonica]